MPQKTGLHFLSIDTWYQRMYSTGCTSGLSLIKLSVTESDQIVGSVMYHDQWGTRSLALDLDSDKTYTIKIQISWHFGITKRAKVYREFNLMV